MVKQIHMVSQGRNWKDLVMRREESGVTGATSVFAIVLKLKQKKEKKLGTKAL